MNAPPRPPEESRQVALATVADGGPLEGVLDFLCRTMAAGSRRDARAAADMERFAGSARDCPRGWNVSR